MEHVDSAGVGSAVVHLVAIDIEGPPVFTRCGDRDGLAVDDYRSAELVAIVRMLRL